MKIEAQKTVSFYRTKINTNPQTTFCGNTIQQDNFQKSTPTNFSINDIQKCIVSNEELLALLVKNDLPLSLNIDSLNEVLSGHGERTKQVAIKIAKNLPPVLQRKIDYNLLEKAAMYHDFGKVLIPEQILNKPTKLNDTEKKIMDLHTEIGALLTKQLGFDAETLKLIRYHHDIDNQNILFDMNAKVLNLADKYTALTEQRVYKQPLSKEVTFKILHDEVTQGKIHPFLYYALVKAVS